ncbi:MAG: tetratricopeptide repeat protein [Desulfobacterales bacterium]|nr:tetratricopeptide repeat protein [Desulfobacterales bacterium]
MFFRFFSVFRGILFTIFLFLATGAYASEMAGTFFDGIKHYKENNFPDAISAFSKVAESGVRNSKLFYNLGNAYLRNDELGQAILWYERALKLTPNDPDLEFNYEYALSLTKDEKDDKTVSIYRILFFWKHILSTKTVQWIAIILNIIFWLVLAIQVLRRKKTLRTANYLILTLAIIFTLTAFYNFYEGAYIKQGIILPSEVSVRSGLTEDSTELFILHAGTKIKIEKENKEFFRISFSDGKIGWLKKSDVGVI